MSRFVNQHTITIAASLVAVLAMATALVFEFIDQPVNRYLLPGVAAGSVVWVLAVSCFAISSRLKEQSELIRFFNDLCQTSPQQLADRSASALTLPKQQLVDRSVLEQIHQRVVSLCSERQQIERERATAEVRWRQTVKSQQQMERMVEGLSDPVLAINEYQEVSLANDSAEELFGFDLAKVEDRAVATLLKCEALVDLLNETGSRTAATSRSTEFSLPDDSGVDRWFSATASTLSLGDSKGKASGAVAILRDVGDRKAAQRRQAEFVSSVSHEMKTPLAGIKAYVELLADGDAEDEQTRDEFLEVINTQADRLQRLIDNMLNLARIEAGVVEVDKQQHSLNEILDEAFRVVQPAAEAKQIRLSTDLSPMFLGVLVDRDMVLQSAINLLSNAVKYTPEKGSVILHSGETDDCVMFEVEDNGVGLSEEDAVGVFEKFYRVKKDRQMASGTGLGLPLAKHIVEEVHRGSLTLTSQLGRGSTFTVKLPKFRRID